MSDDTEKLRARLKRAGIDSGLMRRCHRCGKAKPLVGYKNGRLTWACRTPSCIQAGSPYRLHVTMVAATCERCEDPVEHQLVEMSNGDQVFTCRGCDLVTLLEVTTPTP